MAKTDLQKEIKRSELHLEKKIKSDEEVAAPTMKKIKKRIKRLQRKSKRLKIKEEKNTPTSAKKDKKSGKEG